MLRRISILGSTGSIGTSTLDVVSRHADRLAVVGLAAGRNLALLEEQIERFRPQAVAVREEADGERIGGLCRRLGIRSGWGRAGLEEVATLESADLVVSAVVGEAGLAPTYAAVDRGKTVALANKEALVMAGELIVGRARERGTAILPLDSEHSAIFQCLAGRPALGVRRLILTASGGPFRGARREELERATPESALRHPTWRMGRKITIDSATLMNKGLEVVEACRLFDVPAERVDVVIHPQSVVHSLVEFEDGSLLAQLGPTDMRLPIRQALAWPEVWGPPLVPFDLCRCGPLDFLPVDEETFPSLRIARRALAAGGTAPAAMSVANEVAVEAFLAGRIALPSIWSVIEEVLRRHAPVPADSLEAVEAAADRARLEAARQVEASPPPSAGGGHAPAR